MNKQLHQLLLLLLFLVLIPAETAAVTTNDFGRIGKETIAPNERITLWVPDNVISIASNGYYPSCKWTLSSNYYGYVKIVSQDTWSCTIEGVSASSSTFKLTFKGNSIIGSNAELWNFTGYYEIKVQSSIVYVTDISLNTTTASLDIDDTLQLSATVSPSNATDKSVSWESSNDSVAEVNGGLVIAKANGKATITCKANDGSGKQDTCSVTVTAADSIKVTEISLNYTSASMVVDDTKQLSATVSPSNATDKTVSWTSDNISVAEVDDNGKVTAKARGTATIICKANDGSGKEAKCEITVSSVKSWTKFTSKTAEGIEMTFYSRDDGTCYVYADYSEPSIDINTAGKVTIPEEAEGLRVTSIGGSAFRDCTGITEVIVPKSVESIGSYAFYGCTALSKVSLGNGVRSLGYGVFNDCRSLTTVTGISQLESIDGSAFNITYDTFIPWYNNLPDGLLYLGNVLYKYKGTMPDNTTVDVKEGTTQVGYEAFRGCEGLVGISIPQSLKSIDNFAFEDCLNLISITVASGNEKYDSRNNCNAIVETEKNMIVAGCKTTSFPSTITAIGCYAFYGSGLTEVVIPNNIDSIAISAFAYSSSLKSVMIGRGTRKIMDYVFSGCRKLTSISVASGNPYYESRDNCNAIIEKATDKLIVGCPSTVIPASVKEIGDDAFYNKSLYSLVIPDNVEKIDNYAVEYNFNLQYLTLGKKVKEIGKSAFYGCNALRCIRSFADSPADIDENVFKSSYTDYPDTVYNNATLYVPIGSKINYMTSIGWNKFKNIVEIADDVIPAGTVFKSKSAEGAELVFKVTDSDIKTCELIGSSIDISGKVSIPAMPEGYTLTSIGQDAFYDYDDDRSITEIVVPEGVTDLCDYALDTSHNTLRTITLPSTLTTIGNYVFDESAIKSISIPKNVSKIGYGVFIRCNDLEVISVDPDNAYYFSPDGSNAIIEKASKKLIAGCKTTKIPNDVITIGNRAIYYIDGLTEVVIPASVSSMEEFAFGSCKNLASVTSYIQKPFKIDSLAFSNYEGYIDGKSVYRFTDATLYVPAGTKVKYQTTEGWDKFMNIVEFDASGVSSVSMDVDNNPQIYDLYGRKLDNPRKGINIINGKKVVVK